jgi:IclR helix-turn-helix domain
MQTSEATGQLLAAFRAKGGATTMGALTDLLGVHKNTVRRRLQELIETGQVESTGHGHYRLVGSPRLGSETGNSILQTLEEFGFDAHLTGFDLLAPYAHQFAYQYPHVVYAEPSARDAVDFELARRGFVVASARPGPKPNAPDLSKLVLLRTQPNADQYGIRGHLAPAEKAWVDTLRETSRGNLPFQHMELGRVLRAMLDSGADERKLRWYARRLGYLDRVEGAIHGGDEANPEIAALRAGFIG